ncbi:hypothetical protein OEA41_001487 [Lepraria neglecta]|uniref:Uncharacterized protein n=1 Tax=Lepraria neglecta TaxID=209136 RepID=A0AAE0DP24_9LECA|nr:hypothetical protein OEA41_001487 [Lepraria neglecta]
MTIRNHDEIEEWSEGVTQAQAEQQAAQSQDLQQRVAQFRSQQPQFTPGLSADHAPRGLAEAEEYYKYQDPLFILLSAASRPGATKKPFLTDELGERPLIPELAELIFRTRGNRGGFWTLDLDGKRFIMKVFQNQKQVQGACRIYKAWSGSALHFEQRPLAFVTAHGEYNSNKEPKRRAKAYLKKEAQAPNEALEYDYSVESGPNDDKHASDKSYHPHPSRLSRSLPQDEEQRCGAEFSQWGLCSGFPDPSTFAFDDEHEQGLRDTQLEAPK